jgi:hypothetical protein
MLSLSAARGRTSAAAVVAVLMAWLACPAAAQTVDPNPGKLTFTGGFDFSNAYMFRGLRRDDTRMIMWPFVEGIADVYTGNTGVRRVSLHVGTWNSLHTGSAGLQGTSGRLWHESDIYGTLGLGLGRGMTVESTFTVYTSPNFSFSTIKELAFSLAVDDRDAPAGIAIRPHALVALELGTSPGVGQADIGLNGGTYLELGVAPGWIDPGFTIAFPITVGLSLNDYYELGGVDHAFGYLSLAARAAVPLGGTTSYGAWNVHGGVEFQSLGNTPEAFNGGDQQKVVASVGIGFVY